MTLLAKRDGNKVRFGLRQVRCALCTCFQRWGRCWCWCWARCARCEALPLPLAATAAPWTPALAAVGGPRLVATPLFASISRFPPPLPLFPLRAGRGRVGGASPLEDRVGRGRLGGEPPLPARPLLPPAGGCPLLRVHEVERAACVAREIGCGTGCTRSGRKATICPPNLEY